MAHFEIMLYSTDMRTDLMKMTTKEAEQYRQELLSAAKRHLSKSSHPTAGPDGGSGDGSATSGTGAS